MPPRQRFNAQNFRRALETEIRKKIDEPVAFAVRTSVRATFTGIIDRWPRDTYWSLANHRISIQGRDVVKLEPRNRPEQTGALVSKAENENAKELAKLDRIVAGRRSYNITIGNAVPYAPNVGFRNGQGEFIYQEAADEAAVVVNAELGMLGLTTGRS